MKKNSKLLRSYDFKSFNKNIHTFHGACVLVFEVFFYFSHQNNFLLVKQKLFLKNKLKK